MHRLVSQRVATVATVTAPSRVECVAVETAYVHGPSKEMHNDIAAAKNGDSYADVNQSFFQKLEVASAKLRGLL